MEYYCNLYNMCSILIIVLMLLWIYSRIKHERQLECRLMLQEIIMAILTYFLLLLSRYRSVLKTLQALIFWGDIKGEPWRSGKTVAL
jgi:hypothetical protein